MLPTFQSYGLRLTAHDQARLELDPRFREGDRAIAEYHDRAEGMLPEDRAKISVLLPADQYTTDSAQYRAELKQIQTDLKQTRAELTQAQTNLTRTQTNLTRVQITLAQSQTNLSRSQTDLISSQTVLSTTNEKLTRSDTALQRLLSSSDRDGRLRFTAFKANLMTKFVEKLSIKQKVNIPKEAKGKNDPLHDKTKYMKAAATLFDKFSAQDFKQRTGLDPAYRAFLGNYRKIIEARRAWAHETDDEFARLLLSDQFREEPFRTEENVEQWEKLLLWVSGKETLQEMANAVAEV